MMKVIGVDTLRQRSRSFKGAYCLSLTATTSRPGYHRLTSNSSCQAHSVSGLCRRPRSLVQRSEYGNALRNGKAQTREAQGRAASHRSTSEL
jgi:hypothetical protein